MADSPHRAALPFLDMQRVSSVVRWVSVLEAWLGPVWEGFSGGAFGVVGVVVTAG